MKIFFSVLFDLQTYPANIFMQNGVTFGDRHMGPLALIVFLELHLGLSNSCNSRVERIFNFRENLKSKAKGSFYENSLQTNDLEVAQKLLQWRDELKIAGWNFKTDKKCPVRLKDLANAEQNGIGENMPERFCNIVEAMQEKPQLPLKGIIIHEPPELLPSHFTKLFSLLAASGVNISYREILIHETGNSDLETLRSFVLDKDSSKEKTALKADGSIQILRFGDMLSAGKGLAGFLGEDLSFTPVIINETGDISLSLSLQENGLPSTGQAMQTVSHPDLQLLSIIPVWLWKPYIPQQVLDFFLSPLNIFPQGLSAKWMNLFSENPGICLEDWMKEIEQYQTSYSTQEEKEKHKERLNFILNTAEERSEKISIEKISNYYSFFYNIFNRRCAVTTDEQIKTRLTRLCNAFKEMLSVLQLAPETELDAFGLQKLLQLLLRPVSVIPFEKEAGSLHEISDAGLLAADCDDLLWFGFTANKSGGTVWNEWTSEEILWLKEKGVLIETAIVKAKRAFWFSTQWLRFVKKRLIFVIPTTDKGEAAQPHAFHPFLNACFTNLHSITINVEQPCDMQLLNSSHQLTKRITVNNIPSFPAYWQIKTHLLTKRDEESFSSLENLMKYPYRWVLRYKADLYRGNTFCLPDNFMFYGTLSHKIFQELLLTAGILEFRENKSKELYRITAEKFINQKGLLLHAQGEEANLKIFRETLFEKLRILLKHLKDNNWQVEGCEIKGSGKIGDETVGGYCDLLLSRMKDNKIEKAIVDLKYSGRSKYRKLMEDGQDLQLAIYSKIFHPLANFCPTSYFIITDGLLFTTCKEAFKNGIILRHDIHYTATYAEVIQKIENTTKFRRKELSQGKIEIGESVCMEDLDVFELDSDSYILPIVEKKTKCRSDYNDYVTFIDTE